MKGRKATINAMFDSLLQKQISKLEKDAVGTSNDDQEEYRNEMVRTRSTRHEDGNKLTTELKKMV